MKKQENSLTVAAVRLGAALASFTLVAVGCGTPGATPEAAPEEAPLSPAVVDAAEPLDPDPQPAWVDDPAAFYEPRRTDVALFVVSSRPMGSAERTRSAAMVQARAQKAMAGSGMRTRVSGESAPEGETRRVQSSGVATQLTMEVLAEWIAPDGKLYLLIR